MNEILNTGAGVRGDVSVLSDAFVVDVDDVVVDEFAGVGARVDGREAGIDNLKHKRDDLRQKLFKFLIHTIEFLAVVVVLSLYYYIKKMKGY